MSTDRTESPSSAVPEVDADSRLVTAAHVEDAEESSGPAAIDATAPTRELDQLDQGNRPAIPTTVGPFAIERLLGSGGMGAVYLGRAEDGKPVAVKVLPSTLSAEPGLVERFNREIDALGRLNSPNIVRLVGRGSEELPTGGSYPFYAMEFVDGETLVDRIHEQGRLPWLEVVAIGVQVCRALKAAHNAGIIHRDLKPSNLLLTEDGDGGTLVKLTDFGVAQMFASSRLTATGGMVGTAEYMSPEQAAGRRVTKQSDLYSLGAVLYVAAVGRPPFTGGNAIDIAQKHRAGLFDSPKRVVPELPRWLDEVISHCLQKAPEDRPADAYVLQRRLSEIPKKVELSQSEDTREAPIVRSPQSDDPADAIGGTIVAQLVRDEIERQNESGSVGRALDNTFVLVGLLTSILMIVFWALFLRTPNATSELEQIRTLLVKDDPESWAAAARRLDRLPSATVAAFRQTDERFSTRLALSQVQRRAMRSGRTATNALPEQVRLIDEAVALAEQNKTREAIERLEALQLLIDPETDAAVATVLEAQLERLAQSRAPEQEREFIRKELREIVRLRGEDEPEAAEERLRALKVLYPNNPAIDGIGAAP